MAIRTDRKTWIISICAVTLVFLVLTFDLVSMRCIFKWDAWYLFWPMFHSLVSALDLGRLPLWEPRACCGFPFHAEPQTGTFYPVFILVGLLAGGGFKVYQALWLMHWLSAIVGFFFLVKKLGLSPLGAFVGSILFGFNGFFIGQASQTVCIITLAYIPWILLLLDSAWDRGIYYAFPAGVLFGLTGLGGHPGMTVYSALMIVVWCLLKYKLTRRGLAVLGATFCVGLIVLSPTYFSFFSQMAGYTDRVTSLSVGEACTVNRFPWSGLLSLLAPGLTVAYPALFDTTADRVAMLNGYCGILGVTSLVVVALNAEMRQRWLWLLWFTLIAFLFSLGSAGGLQVIGYYLLPPLRFVRHPSFIRIFWMLSSAILAGWVLDRLVFSDAAERSRLVSALLKSLGVGLAALVGACLWAWLTAESAVVTEPAFASISFKANSFAEVFSHTAAQLGIILLSIIALCFYRTGLPSKIAVSFVILVVVLDAAAHLHTNKYTLCWNSKARTVSTEFEHAGEVNARVPLNPYEDRVSTPVTFNKWAFDGRSYIRAYIAPTSASYDFLVGNAWVPCQDTKFLRVLEKSPRFWLVPAVQFCRIEDKQALTLVKDSDGTGPVPVFVHDATERLSAKPSDAVTPGAYGQVTVLRYAAEEAVLQVNAPADCWLFSTERYAEGWKADIDGSQIELCKANFCFRGVPVPKGQHIVRMHYAPWLYKPLLGLSWGLIVLALILCGVLRIRSLRGGSREEDAPAPQPPATP
ncbi:MAG: YfhO family protein [Desulfomonile tiedjei]|nr:YfhO family protein [Desulfomonile tiedjei]